MARQLGVIQYRGKLGQTVGMKNGYGGSESFSREYVSTNSSQSDAQIERRMRLLPAVNFRRQLADLISRGFQGVKYGGPSTREYMKFAMVMPLADTPQLVKNSTVAFPGPYLISKGSLGNIACTIGEDTITTNLRLSGGIYTTIGDLSTALIAGGMVRQGDLVTIVHAYIPSAEQDDVQNVTYERWSFQVDADSTDNLPAFQTDLIMILEESTDTLEFTTTAGYISVGMGIVISREGTTPLRSTSRFGVNKAFWPNYFGSVLKPAVKQSYIKTTSTTRSTNWPYDPDIEPEESGFVTIGVTISPTGGGTVTGTGTYARGDSVTLQATAASGYSFTRWTLNDVQVSTSRTLTITANGNANYVAEFLPEG